jgi:hypothetical protein
VARQPKSAHPPNCPVHGRGLRCPLNVDSRRRLKRLKSANSGHSQTVRRTGNSTPLRAFTVEPRNGREVRETRLPLTHSAGREGAGAGATDPFVDWNIGPLSVFMWMFRELRRIAMASQLASPLFIAGELLLGLSLTVFVGAFIATVGERYRSHRR